MRKFDLLLFVAAVLVYLEAVGCGNSGGTMRTPKRNEDPYALGFFVQGLLLEQQGDFAKAILVYQRALSVRRYAAVLNSIARDYALLGDNDQAISFGLDALREDPSNRLYHETLAQIYASTANPDAAIAQYQEVVRLDSSYRDGWINLAHLLQVQHPSDAARLLQVASERFGPSMDILFQQAQIYITLNDLEKGMEILERVLKLDPGNFEISKMLGDLYLRRDSTDAALQIYESLAERQPSNLELRSAIAQAYLIKQDYDRATFQFDVILSKDTLSLDDQLKFAQIFTQFLQQDSLVAPYALKVFAQIRDRHPEDWRSYWFLGTINNILKDDSSALVNFSKLRDLARWNPDGWVGIASILYDRNEFSDAIRVLNEATRTVPEEFRIYFLLGLCYHRVHRFIEAATALERAIQLNNKNVDALGTLALIYDEMKRPDESDSIYEKALRLEPRNHLLLNNYSYSLADRGFQLERALSMARDAIKQQPNNQSYLDTYGWIYFRMGNFNEAEKWVRRAVELGSQSPTILEHLGDIYFKLSRRDKAIEFWKKALDLDSSNSKLKEKIDGRSL